MNKEQLRKEAKAILPNLPSDKKAIIEKYLTEQLFQTKFWQKAKTIGVTMALEHEWDTQIIIKKAWEEGKIVAIPKCNPRNKQLTFFRFSKNDELEVGPFHIREPIYDENRRLEPEEIELLIVPGLLFDIFGFRIGFGGGYYDRFLERFSNISVSIISTDQLHQRLPHEAYDLPVDILLTNRYM